MTTTEESMFPGWAIVEVMGHNRFAGHVQEYVFAGTAFIRIDVPETEETKPFTKLIGPSSIFGITPCSEEAAKQAASSFRAAPHYLIDIEKPRPIDAPAIAATEEPRDAWDDFEGEDDDREDFGEGSEDEH